MSEFREMLREALIGDEPFQEQKNEAHLRAAVERYDRRMKTVRFMAWFPVGFMGLVVAVCVWRFAVTEPAEVKALLAYTALFVFAMTAIGWSKLWLMVMHNHIESQKELVRVQMLLLGVRED